MKMKARSKKCKALTTHYKTGNNIALKHNSDINESRHSTHKALGALDAHEESEHSSDFKSLSKSTNKTSQSKPTKSTYSSKIAEKEIIQYWPTADKSPLKSNTREEVPLHVNSSTSLETNLIQVSSILVTNRDSHNGKQKDLADVKSSRTYSSDLSPSAITQDSLLTSNKDSSSTTGELAVRVRCAKIHKTTKSTQVTDIALQCTLHKKNKATFCQCQILCQTQSIQTMPPPKKDHRLNIFTNAFEVLFSQKTRTEAYEGIASVPLSEGSSTTVSSYTTMGPTSADRQIKCWAEINNENENKFRYQIQKKEPVKVKSESIETNISYSHSTPATPVSSVSSNTFQMAQSDIMEEEAALRDLRDRINAKFYNNGAYNAPQWSPPAYPQQARYQTPLHMYQQAQQGYSSTKYLHQYPPQQQATYINQQDKGYYTPIPNMEGSRNLWNHYQNDNIPFEHFPQNDMEKTKICQKKSLANVPSTAWYSKTQTLSQPRSKSIDNFCTQNQCEYQPMMYANASPYAMGQMYQYYNYEQPPLQRDFY